MTGRIVGVRERVHQLTEYTTGLASRLVTSTDSRVLDELDRRLSDLAGVALAELGTTSGAEVAASLTELGIRGDHSTTGNPVAVYLARTLSAPEAVVRGGISAVLSYTLPNGDGRSVEDITVPSALEEFFTGFTAGRYPQLEMAP
ncbi:hypothetical protein [Actinoplanes sp. NPDC051494]|uniref:hypothetical protein n=1 Tax=Actinoplanes sp. NPDC051494 TaxID=3363907 RepID=UPI0037BCD303